MSFRLFLTVGLLLLIRCGSKNSNSSVKSSTIRLRHAQTPIETLLFKYEMERDTQKLSVSWISIDSITFDLVSISDPCVFTQTGIAVIADMTCDLEIDEDVNGVAYPVSEYIVVEKVELKTIRIEQIKKSKARITYNYEDIVDECDPFDHVIMTKC